MLLAKGHSPLEKVGPNRLLGTAQWLVTLIDWECYLDIPTSIKKKKQSYDQRHPQVWQILL